MIAPKTVAIALALFPVIAGCALEEETESSLAALSGPGASSSPSAKKRDKTPNGRHLFRTETFDGNGRTCESCHGKESGTIAPADVAAAYASDPGHPLFRALDSDDGEGEIYSRLLSHATIRVSIPLPMHFKLESDPEAESVVFARGVPSTLNTPGSRSRSHGRRTRPRSPISGL